MKKKIILGKKLFLNKETITNLTNEQQGLVLGGSFQHAPTGTEPTGLCATCQETCTGGGTAGTGSLCNTGCQWNTVKPKCDSVNFC